MPTIPEGSQHEILVLGRGSICCDTTKAGGNQVKRGIGLSPFVVPDTSLVIDPNSEKDRVDPHQGRLEDSDKNPLNEAESANGYVIFVFVL